MTIVANITKQCNIKRNNKNTYAGRQTMGGEARAPLTSQERPSSLDRPETSVWTGAARRAPLDQPRNTVLGPAISTPPHPTALD